MQDDVLEATMISFVTLWMTMALGAGPMAAATDAPAKQAPTTQRSGAGASSSHRARAAGAKTRARDTSASMLNPNGFTSAEICAGCHKDIHAAWAESVHGRSFTDPLFGSALKETAEKDGAAAAQQCLSCHAPTTRVTKDTDAHDPITREGITCSFCHAITEAGSEFSDGFYKVEPGQTMRGPFQFASSPGHATLYSPLHRTARICAPCHQFQSAAGVPVLNTFAEWQQGPWPAQGVQCQDCHMALVPGAVAETIDKPAQASAQDRRLINLHRLVGGSSLGQLRRALSLRIKETKHSEGTIRAVVEVKNDAAGHRAPTGLPTRWIVLRVDASRDGKSFHTEERMYRREMVDAAGAKILTTADAFRKAAKISTDTRIAPGETRQEIFSFAAPPGASKLVVSLDYMSARDPHAPPQATRFQELTAEVP